MIRILPFIIELALVVFCLVDCAQSDAKRIRNLPKWGWIILMLLVPIVGCIAWLFVGRPTRASAEPAPPQQSKTQGFPQYRPPSRPMPLGPDDDPEFLRSLKRRNTENEDLLKRWEEDFQRREDELRKDEETNEET